MLSDLASLVLRHIQSWRNPGEMLNSVQASRNRCQNVKEIETQGVCRMTTRKGKDSVRTKRRSRLP